MANIRPVRAVAAHAAAMALVHGQAFPPGERWSADALGLQMALPGAFGWMAGQGGFVLARTAADEAEILTLAVHPAAQRQGVGRLLLHAALDEACVQGARMMFLEVASGNAAALGLYLTGGFKKVGLRPRYYPNGADALVLACPLTCGAAAADGSRPPRP